MSNFVSNPKHDSLADRLRDAARAYYAGNPIITDAEFDALENALRKGDPDHPVFSEIGAPVASGWSKVSHPIPMGSLDKAQTDEEYLAWVTSKVKVEPLFLSEKLDGISILLTYQGGDLVRAETRGDGNVGEDITRNVRIMEGVPSGIPFVGTAWVRMEIICRKSVFEKHFQGESNPRNTAAGTAKRQTGWLKAKHLTVIAYNLTTSNNSTRSRSEEFQRLKEWGFKLPGHYFIEDPESVLALRENYIQGKRSGLDYDIDGLVVEINDTAAREALGHHNHRPKGALAFKFPHEEKQTTLRDIVWQVGASGRVTPVAVFDAVDLAGASVKQASLHNVSNIYRLVAEGGQQSLYEGDHLLVSRRNDVIPYVESVLGANEYDEEEDGSPVEFHVPTECPECSTNLSMLGEYLVCANEMGCSAQVLGSLSRWLTKVGVLHFGDSLLNAVVDAGMVSTIGDLYRLDGDQVAALELDGRRVGGSAKRALDSLYSKKEMTLDLFVGSLGIPLVGRKMVKILTDAGIDSLSKMAKATEAEMAAIPNFGEGRAASFRVGFDTRRNLIFDILAAGVVITEPEIIEIKGSAMDGQAVCFTGVRDKDAEAALVSQGGKIASGVSKNTTLLVVKDVNSSSSKAKKARGLGIEIIDLDALWARLGGRS